MIPSSFHIPAGLLVFAVLPALGAAWAPRFGWNLSLWMDFWWTVGGLIQTFGCFGTARALPKGDLRRAWMLFGCGSAAWTAGQLVWDFQEAVLHKVAPFPSLADLGFLSLNLFFIWGFLYLRDPQADPLTARRKLCNLGILLCSIVAMVLMMASPALAAFRPTQAFFVVMLGWGALSPAAVLFGFICLCFYVPRSQLKPAGVLLAGLTIMAAANVMYAVSQMKQAYQVGRLPDFLWVLGNAVIFWAAHEQRRKPRISQATDRRFTGHFEARFATMEAALPALSMAVLVIVAAMLHERWEGISDYLFPVFALLVLLIGVRESWTLAYERRLFGKLSASESRFRRIVEANVNGLAFWDISGTITEANDPFLRMVGYTREDLLAGRLNWSRMTPPEYAELDQRSIAELLEKGACTPFEKEYIRKDGTRVPILLATAAFHGMTSGGVAFIVDLTDLKAAQEALRQSEQRLRALIENGNEGIAIWDHEGLIRFLAPSSERILGYRCEDLVGQSARPFIHPEDWPALEEAFQKTLEEPGCRLNIHARVRRLDGAWRLCEGSFMNLIHEPAIGGVVLNYRDVTEQDEAARALRESESRLQAFLDNSPAIMFIKDPDGLYQVMNRTFERVFGRSARELIGKSDTEFLSQEGAAQAIESDRAIVASGQTIESRFRLESLTGPRTCFITKFPLKDTAGQVYGIGGIVTDITERHQAEEALRRSEERFRNLIEGARDAIFTISAEGIITSLNSAAETITGWPNDHWLGKSFIPLIHRNDVHRAQEIFRRTLCGERLAPFELRVCTRAGGIVPLEFTMTPQQEDGSTIGLIGIARDVTRRHQLEEQLRQSQKMESIGQLAGGVAHDFNNLLTIIQGNASLMLLDEGITRDFAEMAEEIRTASERATSLTRQLLAFSRRQLIEAQDLDLNEVITDLSKMLRRLLGEDITLQFNSSSNLPLVHADAGMMEQVLLNLAVNARDAMPEGGYLTISTNHVHLPPEVTSRNPEARPGHFVRVTVSDTGCGIDESHIPHIFEPFFTTKDVGKGTGLGLATVYGIVKQHQGWIELRSEVSKGTAFEIFLPVREKPAVRAEEPAPNGELPRGNETILIVEDEAPVRAVVRGVLNRLGYRVLEASSGAEALKLWDNYSDEVDLVFTDIVMPDGVSGTQLADELRKRTPELKVVFTSGYSAKALMKGGRMREGVKHLQKPYPPAQLATTVREALDGKSAQ